jgi:hypothetical protein
VFSLGNVFRQKRAGSSLNRKQMQEIPSFQQSHEGFTEVPVLENSAASADFENKQRGLLDSRRTPYPNGKTNKHCFDQGASEMKKVYFLPVRKKISVKEIPKCPAGQFPSRTNAAMPPFPPALVLFEEL